MMRMITDLLNLSRMDQNRLELDKEFVNMNELVKHIANRFDMVLSSDPISWKELPYFNGYHTTRLMGWNRPR